MEKIFINDTTRVAAPQAATIGFFDGVHRGHRFLIDQVRQVASQYGLQSMVVTFDRHPRQVLRQDYQPRLLTTTDTKTLLLSKTGIDNCAVLHFDMVMAQLSAFDFMKSVLRERLNVRLLVIGYDNRFGHNRAEGFDDYRRYGEALGITVVEAKPLLVDGAGISSTMIRHQLDEGNVEKAAELLGYNYTFYGKVVEGYREGRKIGFPTANVDLGDTHQIVPAHGVYAVLVRIKGSMTSYMAMMNIGTRPTFDGHGTTLETHILDFEGDLYHTDILVEFVRRLRDERKFPSADALKAQLVKDRDEVRELFSRGHDIILKVCSKNSEL